MLFVLLLLSFQLFAQFDRMKQTLDDEINLSENGMITLRFYDAVSGLPVDDATIFVESFAVKNTDLEGKIELPSPKKEGSYAVSFSKPGYIKATFNFEWVAGTIFSNRFFVSPVIDIKAVRIVLAWGKKPDDLDLHLEKINAYHISYRNLNASSDGSAKLDRDALNGFGPETITLSDLDDQAEYRCFVHDFSNRDKASSNVLSKSKANVMVYMDGELKHNFTIEPATKGNQWEVFSILNGKLTILNKLSVTI